MVKWYAREFKDPMMVDPPAWFKTFIFTEIVFQLPFFFIAAHVLWKGLKNNCWIRVPLIVYSTHVSTVTMTICNHVLTHDFSNSDYPGPETLKERLTLLAVYSPYLFIPVILLFDSLFSSIYRKETFEIINIK
ncbi:hypothetical protein KUTeg_025017 [Tegillarca granosa]|uniref:Sigma intracellular receptor 2 n=1 Tax=Tegillarca granosa TaxID=220873 RepID=A0ABQ9E247_TEGGR|nr:hypothetical protein KUTeg_025017 [Tegillarca granosa]